MSAYRLLIVAVLSRVVPHPGWWNFTAVGGTLLYFGARRSWREVLAPLAVLIATDCFLTVFSYHYTFMCAGLSAHVVVIHRRDGPRTHPTARSHDVPTRDFRNDTQPHIVFRHLELRGLGWQWRDVSAHARWPCRPLHSGNPVLPE